MRIAQQGLELIHAASCSIKKKHVFPNSSPRFPELRRVCGACRRAGQAIASTSPQEAILLQRDILDALIVDLQHRRVTRANDLWLEEHDQGWRLAAADTSARALVRRLSRGRYGRVQHSQLDGTGDLASMDYKRLEPLMIKAVDSLNKAAVGATQGSQLFNMARARQVQCRINMLGLGASPESGRRSTCGADVGPSRSRRVCLGHPLR